MAKRNFEAINEIKHELPSSDKFDIAKLQYDNDLTEQLGELTLRQIQMKKDKSNRWFPLYPDSVFKSAWDFIAMGFIVY